MLKWLIEITRKAFDLPKIRFVPWWEPISEEFSDEDDYEEDYHWYGSKQLDGIHPKRFYRNRILTQASRGNSSELIVKIQ